MLPIFTVPVKELDFSFLIFPPIAFKNVDLPPAICHNNVNNENNYNNEINENNQTNENNQYII